MFVFSFRSLKRITATAPAITYIKNSEELVFCSRSTDIVTKLIPDTIPVRVLENRLSITKRAIYGQNWSGTNENAHASKIDTA